MNNCPKCNSAIIETINGSSAVYSCSKCDWKIARSWTDPINEDETTYSIYVDSVTQVAKESISAVAKVANINFVKAKSIIVSGGLLLEGKAVQVKDSAGLLKAAGVSFDIRPDFPY